MDEVDYHIAIISDQALRAESLSKTIEKGLKRQFGIPVFQTEYVNSVNNLPKPLLLLIDLMGSSQTYKQIIIPILKIDSEIKIIALHLYQSSELVNPLYKAGIQGYLFYEPTREELLHAIKTVANGKKYIPDYLIPS